MSKLKGMTIKKISGATQKKQKQSNNLITLEKLRKTNQLNSRKKAFMIMEKKT